MKKVKKMADGGISDLGGMVGRSVDQARNDQISPMPMPGGGGSGKGGSAFDGLGTVNQGAQDIGSALGRASEAIGGGNGGSPTGSMYKKGGKVTTTRMSTASRSSKSPNW
jgi:hypothetical protein